MKHSYVVAASAVLTLGTWASLTLACGDEKAKTKVSATAASAKSTASAAAMASGCTPEMAAACKAHGVSAATMQGCSHATKASSASASGCGSSTAKAGKSSTSARSLDAVTLSAPAGAQSVDAVLVGGSSCSGHGAAKTADAKQSDCDGCADMAFCEGEAKSMGATVQIVPLKNGVMYVYTAADPSKVHAVQASMGRRSDRMSTLLAAGDKAHLCPTCKSVRGSIASGKLNRELVNIEGGCLTLMTSSDPATLAKIYSLAGLKGPMSTKM